MVLGMNASGYTMDSFLMNDNVRYLPAAGRSEASFLITNKQCF